MQKGVLIEGVATGSPAEQAGVLAGQRLVAIDGKKISDLIDYSWLSGYGDSEITLLSADGNSCNVTIRTEPGKGIGLTFAPPEPKRCGNNCIFCFVHQLPKGLRRPLYVKDEDYRLSFLYGTYVTLSNLKQSELERIIRLRLSPLYISVHAVDPETREKLLGRKNIPPILEQLKSLTAAGIELHTQVVLCPGLNDGEKLEQTVDQLAMLHPMIRSLAVVPVGLTSHRQHLPRLQAVDARYAASFLEEWLPRVKQINRRLGEPFLQLADEFFLKCSHPFPPLSWYGDLPQWENGVGMTPWFLKDANRVLKRARPLPPLEITVVTGLSAEPFVAEFLQKLGRLTGCSFRTAAIPNRLFGETVTVTGLIAGEDIITGLANCSRKGHLLLPGVMLKEGEDRFLDDMPLKLLQSKLGMQVTPFEPSPAAFYRTVRQLARRSAETAL